MMLLKSLLGIRVTQLSLSLLFLIFVSWVAYLVTTIEATQNYTPHLVTTILRFLLPILTLPYTAWEIIISIKSLRSSDPSNKYVLRTRSRAFKVIRGLFEFALGGLWFLAFVFSLGVGSWVINGENVSTDSSTDPSAGSNSTAPLTASSASVVPQGSMSAAAVPPGGKIPMVLGSTIWILLIGLFALSALGVLIQTIRNWRSATPDAEPAKIEMV